MRALRIAWVVCAALFFLSANVVAWANGVDSGFVVSFFTLAVTAPLVFNF